ncbi:MULTISPECIES: N-acetylornithine carbamoyltransferase [Flectobacillus]|jgi:N-succinyl-L-ornithine transcarbamylase|uniref:N-succinylornithine carbamoyltransferase n=2 Tax=Flectobacillus TaxID=101 RepID=A0ABT6YN99_9BACT|nr:MULTISPECIES: N-acetylornithine carbamoyltransferase [Flectobacillus]NBA77173.1 N-acetylornithine carbamoyltransferase [Emticicia sp. ODNR4P]MDI9859175.1 N-acetylornithine carbamoyltransferase [Flectobacillus roseus]MDI9865050.1 N-acetylornithine carbamoyltransferase [Flectobacillus longus]MDI9868130.1 N-acetylornithine carbamoyltransferase [Flectobacillus roseus]PAC33113.1 acetylornithine carbamoyltransferase [Flectobacillus sp. BAB-3569]
MRNFLSVKDAVDVQALVKEALLYKKTPYADKHLGKNRTMGLLFFNSSLRTRLSTQRAAQNLGLELIVMNVGQDSWGLEFEDGAIMNGNKAEHIKEAAPVVGQYCDIVGIRSFPGLVDREEDYSENVMNQFVKHTGRPILSLESATRHPLQSLADLITIEELKTKPRPKVVLTWAPHVKALPQAVPNSFAEWMNAADVDFVITHPEGYELAPEFVGNAKVTYNQEEAFKDADFIYAKNWSSYSQYGQILNQDPSWMVTMDKMNLTNNAKFMHCLPVRRNVVVEDAVLDSPNSVVVQQAGNRVWSAQVVIKQMLLSIIREESPYLF